MAMFAVLKRTVSEFRDDNLTDWAAALTYYSVMSLFPALIALVAILGLVGSQGTIDSLLEIIGDVGPDSAVETFRGPVERVVNGDAGAGVALVISLALALWTASGYVGAFMRASNAIYEVEEGRSFWKLRPLQMVVALVMVLLLALIVTMLAFLYYAAPNVRQPSFRWLTPGSGLAIVVWVLASIGFGIYVANFGSYNKTYGALGGAIVFLIWLWLSNVAVLLGAELNAEIEREREIKAGNSEATEQIQLEPRREPA